MARLRVRVVVISLGTLAVLLAGVYLAVSGGSSIDGDLAAVVDEFGLEPLAAAPAHAPELVELGQMLFFDPLLSGNKDTSCATCHHPVAHTSDDLSVSVGTGGSGVAGARVLGEGRSLIPRNAPDLYNRGHDAWSTMFWDMRVTDDPAGGFASPAGELLPEELESVLAVQAMFPVTSPDEMRGKAGDLAVDGSVNELAPIGDTDFTAMWDGLMARLLAVPEYRDMFAAAFPDVPESELGFQHAANAIAAFEADAFGFVDAPWDRYLAGESAALSDEAKHGALLFFGEAGCATCHTGALFTDQQSHNIGAPQVGPGKGDDAPMDYGRFLETGEPADMFAFRTPSLRNVELTGPWLHDGAYTTLEAVIRHHLDPATALRSYDVGQLRSDVAAVTVLSDEWTESVLSGIDAELAAPRQLSDEEIGQLEAFLLALTDPGARDLMDVMPDTVPSGFPVER